ncbi:hypothetical protein BST36_13525 [Mycolicibacterium moriokaense]|nr:hypothetical protein [Mycolicibacterium moriokaense]ORB22999.1 hypothetical protein BST36_13525 [Mycolicibacterium moriokaense]
MVLCVGRHSKPKTRRTSPFVLASILGPAALWFAVGGDGQPAKIAADGPAEQAAPRDVAIVATGPIAQFPAPLVGQVSLSSGSPDTIIAASRYRTVDRTLPVGLAPERGLQVKTILASRAITEAFPEIRSIGGVRPDALRWHPNGLALDVMIPNPGSAEGIALGNEIVDYVLRNAARFSLQDAIWRGVYYTPNGGQRAGGYGHYDHVHVTTTGGGYPTGNENYYR